MDFSYSGARDYVYEVLGQVQEKLGIPESDEFTKYKSEACEEITKEIVFPYVEDALAWVGKTRTDMDKAQDADVQKYIEEEAVKRNS